MFVLLIVVVVVVVVVCSVSRVVVGMSRCQEILARENVLFFIYKK